MPSLKDHLKLRLAARTLIEWKTPITAPEYQRVLTDLLELHPNAASWGLVPNKELFKLDNEGVVLWYLSETIDLKKDTSYDTYDKYKDFIQERCIDGLFDFGTSEENTDAMTGAFSKPQIADTIYKSITSDNIEENFLGFFSLLALIVPLSHGIQVENLKKLFLKKDPRSKVVQSIKKTMVRFAIAFSTTKIIAITTSIIAAILAFSAVFTLTSAIDAKRKLETKNRNIIFVYKLIKDADIPNEKYIKIEDLIQKIDKKTQYLNEQKSIVKIIIKFYKDENAENKEVKMLEELLQEYEKLSKEYEISSQGREKIPKSNRDIEKIKELNTTIEEAKYLLEGIEKKYKGFLGFLIYNAENILIILLLSTVISTLLIFIKKNSFQEIIKRIMKRRYREAETMVERIIQKDPGLCLMGIIGNTCGSNSGVLLSMLQTKTSTLWGEIALNSTNEVTREVVCESLTLIRNPEIDETTREKLFRWLCMVNIV